VTDGLDAPSEPDEVVITTANSAPVASAGPDQLLSIPGSTVQLSGSGSYDSDGDSISFSWTIAQKPIGSAAALAGATSQAPTFVADIRGQYVIRLVVTDSAGAESAPDTVTVRFANRKPVANAGRCQSVPAGSTVQLDGSRSWDPNGDPLTYAWSIVKKPRGSAAQLGSADTVTTSFVADLPGHYIIRLLVSDGFVASHPSLVVVNATPPQPAAVETLRQAVVVIDGLPPAAFKNRHLARALVHKINAVLWLIGRRHCTQAAHALERDILRKTDGCARTGAPDRNDWINDCGAQAQVYALVVQAIDQLRGPCKHPHDPRCMR
jgi:hypothetical protein